MTPDLDEMTRRRPDFPPGVPVVLSDGRAWHFPAVRARPDHAPGGGFVWTVPRPPAGRGEAARRLSPAAAT